MSIRGTVVAWLGAGLLAQAPVEIARATAIGGDCERILIASDQQHALTCGEHGDLIWWDLQTREVLQHVAAQTRYLAHVELHPSEPIAFVSWVDRKPKSYQIHRIELASGRQELLFRGDANTFCLDPTGERIAIRQADLVYVFAVDALPTIDLDRALEKTRAPHRANGIRFDVDGRIGPRRNHHFGNERQAVSADGAHRIEAAPGHDRSKIRIDEDVRTFASEESWLTHCAVANDGTVVLADGQGQVHFTQAAGGPTTVRAPHWGTTQYLLFSPDGRFVAINTLGAVRIIDLDGKVVLDVQGSATVCRGEAGSEFWLFTREKAWRYHASSRRIVGDEVRPDQPSAVVVDRPSGEWTLLRAGGVSAIWKPAPACVLGGSAWRSQGGKSAVSRWNGSMFAGIETGSDEAVELCALPGGNGMAALFGSTFTTGNGTGYRTRLTIYNSDGTWLAQNTISQMPQWIAANDRGDTVWIGDTHTVTGYAIDDCTKVARHQEPWLHAATWKDGLLLISRGGSTARPFSIGDSKDGPAQLQLVDPRDAGVHTSWPLPADMTSAHRLAVSPTHTHIAIAQDQDVRILQLPN